MAARVRGQRRSRSVSSQPGEDDSETERNTLLSKLYATLLVFLGIFLYVYVLYTVLANLLYPCSFSPFLSRHNDSDAEPTSSDSNNETDDVARKCYAPRRAILYNAALLIIFVVQHSLMASRALKEFWKYLGWMALSRILYVFSTCFTLQFIYHYWISTPHHTIWDCEGYFLTTLLKLVHCVCWLSITCSLFTIDYLELLGIKQFYYSYNGFSNPLYYKSAEQQRLLLHMRHPIFTAPFILVWAVPVMTYDRLLVAVLLPLYIAWGSSIKETDMAYVRGQFFNKWIQLLPRQQRQRY